MNFANVDKEKLITGLRDDTKLSIKRFVDDRIASGFKRIEDFDPDELKQMENLQAFYMFVPQLYKPFKRDIYDPIAFPDRLVWQEYQSMMALILVSNATKEARTKLVEYIQQRGSEPIIVERTFDFVFFVHQSVRIDPVLVKLGINVNLHPVDVDYWDLFYTELKERDFV